MAYKTIELNQLKLILNSLKSKRSKKIEDDYHRDKLFLKTKSVKTGLTMQNKNSNNNNNNNNGANSNFKITLNDFYATGFKSNTDRGHNNNNNEKYKIKFHKLFQVNSSNEEDDCLVETIVHELKKKINNYYKVEEYEVLIMHFTKLFYII